MTSRRFAERAGPVGRLGLMLGAALVAVVGVSSGGAAQTFSTLYTFTGDIDGGFPASGLIFDVAGNLYGTTYFGGGSGCGGFGCGTVFKLTPNGDGTYSEIVLWSFAGGSDGQGPLAGLVFDTSGNLYGTTYYGGGSGCGGSGCGTVFIVFPDGTEIVDYSFAGAPDGANPVAGLVFDNSGNLYGTTPAGGNSGCGGNACGIVFQVAPDGTESVLYSFTGTGFSDGANPQAGLIFDGGSGNLYGTTAAGGGSGCGVGGCGTVFQVALPSPFETVLYSFTGIPDGSDPLAGLIIGPSGGLFGTTATGGNSACPGGGCGTVFERFADGTEGVLYTFAGGTDGAIPYGGLIMDAAGNLYGTTSAGGGSGCGGNGCGTVFKLTSGGLTVLHSFAGMDGSFLSAGLISDAAGNLYGTTQAGGAFGNGTVFKLTP